MLRKVFPPFTILRSVIIEEEGEVSFGRQMGSYPILVGIPLPLPVRTVLDVVVVDHGMRSLTALPCPVPINTLPHKALRWIPGLSKKGMVQLLAKRPFRSEKEFAQVTGTSLPDGMLDLTLPAAQLP